MKKQLTDEQIKKALICCYKSEGLTCVEMQCPLCDVSGCNDVLMAEYVIDYINRLETQKKCGKWIPYEIEDTYGENDENTWYRCSECGKDVIGRCYDDEWYSFPRLTKYCPHCGAKVGDDL